MGVRQIISQHKTPTSGGIYSDRRNQGPSSIRVTHFDQNESTEVLRITLQTVQTVQTSIRENDQLIKYYIIHF